MKNIRQVYVSMNRGFPVAHVAAHFGEGLFQHFVSQGIDATVVQRSGSLWAFLEMDENVDLATIQTALSRWESSSVVGSAQSRVA